MKYEISGEAGGAYFFRTWEGRASEFDKIVRQFWNTIRTTGALPDGSKVYDATFTRGNSSTECFLGHTNPLTYPVSNANATSCLIPFMRVQPHQDALNPAVATLGSVYGHVQTWNISHIKN